MFNLIITLDYELPGDGRGDVLRHMIHPTSGLLDVCERHGAKLTIMAEMGEIWALENPENQGFMKGIGFDAGKEVRHQLVEAVARGHDVQLHLHPQWLNARWTESGWNLDYKSYRLTDLSHDDAAFALRRGKKDLEDLLCPHESDYRCVGFRAGHWNTQPSVAYLAALAAAGIESDTSVFKWGYARGRTACFDYRDAHSNLEAWYADSSDINVAGANGRILEVPISVDLVPFMRMVSLHRLQLATTYWRENWRISQAAVRSERIAGKKESRVQRIMRALGPNPMKLDFCKLTGPEMLALVEGLTLQQANGEGNLPVPLVMIGHSKQFGADEGLDFFLDKLKSRFGGMIRFATYRGFVDDYQAQAHSRSASATTV